MGEKHATVADARRQLEEICAKLKGQAEAAGHTDFLDLVDAVAADITDEDLQRKIDEVEGENE